MITDIITRNLSKSITRLYLLVFYFNSPHINIEMCDPRLVVCAEININFGVLIVMPLSLIIFHISFLFTATYSTNPNNKDNPPFSPHKLNTLLLFLSLAITITSFF